MAAFMQLPEHLAEWQALQDSLSGLHSDTDFAARLCLFDKKVLNGAPPFRGVPPISIAQYNEVIDTVRPTKPWPIRPALYDASGRPDIVEKIRMRPAPTQAAFTWKWVAMYVNPRLLQPLATDKTVSLAVAVLSESAMIDNYKHLLSLSQLWVLNPLKQPIATRLREGAVVWQVCDTVGVTENHLFRSKNCLAKLEKEEGVFMANPDGLNFSGFMATTLFTLTLLVSVVCQPNQALDVLLWVKEILGFVFATFSQDWKLRLQDGATLKVRGGTASASNVFRIMTRLDMLEKWNHRLRGGGEGGGWQSHPGIEGDQSQRIPVAEIFYAIARWHKTNDCTAAAVKRLAHAMGRLWEASIPNQLLNEPRGSRFFLAENQQLLASAMKGEDKIALFVNAILARRQGPKLEADLPIGDVACTRVFVYGRSAGTISFVSCAMHKGLEAMTAGIRSWKKRILPVRVSFDDSRVASKEVMVSHVLAAGVFAAGPVQIKPDQAAMRTPGAAFERYVGVVTGGAGGRRAPTGIKKRAPTLASFFAITNVLLTLLPVDSWSVFIPSSVDVPSSGGQRVFDRSQKQYFTWNLRPRTGTWCMAGELLARGVSKVWILVFVADEGSTGSALFFWLVGCVRARCIFWRDPSHRTSDILVRTLGKVCGLSEIVCDILLLHKFRRAPYGTGRFFKECKETIALVVSRFDQLIPLIEPFVPGIANDAGVEPELGAIRSVLVKFCRMALGPRVEMRRWFTFVDMGPSLLRIWHVLLLSLTAMAVFDGKDPWRMAADSAATANARRGKKKGFDAGKVSDFEYRSECLRVLLSTVAPAALKSIISVFRLTREHQLWVADSLDQPRRSIRHLLVWSHPVRYLDTVVLPSMRESLANKGELLAVGFTGNVGWTPSEESLELGVDDLEEEQEVLRLHLLTAIELVNQWFVFSLLPQCPPWSYIRCLSTDPAERQASVEQMRAFHRVLPRLESSGLTLAQSILKTLHFRAWPVVREPLMLFEKDGWSVDAKDALEYIEAMAGDYVNTLFEEKNAFNDLRDNEGRAARHKQRGEHYLCALSQSSVRSRYPDLPHVPIADADVQKYGKLQLRASTFHPEQVNAQKSKLGVPVNSIMGKDTWPATTFDALAVKGGSLFKAIICTDESLWGMMWVTSLLPRNAIIGDADAGCFWYVASVTESRALLWRLTESSDSLLRFDFVLDAFQERAVTSFDDYLIYEHSYSFSMTQDATEVFFKLGEARSILGFVAQRTMHTLPMQTLIALRDTLRIPKSKQATQAMLVRDIVKFLGYDATVGGQRVIQQAQELYEKRVQARRQKRTEREAQQEEGSGNDSNANSEGSAAEDVGPTTKAMEIVSVLAPREYGYLMGNVQAGMALNEEEDDPAFETPSAGPPAERGRREARPAAEYGGNARDEEVPAARRSSPADDANRHEQESPIALPAEDIDIMDQPIFQASAVPIHGAGNDDESETVLPLQGESVAMPAQIDSPMLAGLGERASSAFRIPPNENFPAPAGCIFRRYEKSFKARLPAGCMYLGTNSCSRSFGEFRSEEIAYTEVNVWLAGAVSSGVVRW